MRIAACVVAGLVLVAGCEKANKDRVEKSTMVVIDEGAQPRHRMRYAIPAGARQSLDMIMDMDMRMEGAGMGGIGTIKMPRMVMVTDVEVTKVHDKDGAMDLTMTTTDVRLESRPGAMNELMSMMEAELGEMRGVRQTLTLAPDGRTRNMKVDEKSASAKVREQLKQTEQMLEQMTALLPDVPVGVGAKWRVEQTIRQQGMKVQFAYTYEVQEISEHGATIVADVEMTAPPQTIEQQGIKVKLNEMTGHGKFINVLDFTKMVERVDGRLDMSMRMSAAGQSMEMEMGMGMLIGPSGKAAPAARDDDDDY